MNTNIRYTLRGFIEPKIHHHSCIHQSLAEVSKALVVSEPCGRAQSQDGVHGWLCDGHLSKKVHARPDDPEAMLIEFLLGTEKRAIEAGTRVTRCGVTTLE